MKRITGRLYSAVIALVWIDVVATFGFITALLTWQVAAAVVLFAAAIGATWSLWVLDRHLRAIEDRFMRRGRRR